MTDTPRTFSALLALLGDNVAADISPQDIRDVVVSVLAPDVVTAEQYGAARDGSTDDAAEIQAAIDAVALLGGGKVRLRAGTYRVASTLLLPYGVTLEGNGGHSGMDDASQTIVEGSMTSGSVIRLDGRGAGLKGVRVTATAGRQAGSGHGVELRELDNTLTIGRCTLDDVYVLNQPDDGFHLVNAELARVSLCTATECGRYGFFMDDGTEDGGTHVATFNCYFENIRAIECVSAGIWIHSSSGVNTFVNAQALGCDTGAGSGFQIVCAGGSNRFVNVDVEDQQYADNGKATPSAGISLTGRNHAIDGGHFSSLTMSIDCNTAIAGHISGLRVFAGAYGIAQPYAVQVRSNCVGMILHLENYSTSVATTPLRNQSTTTLAFIDGAILLGTAATANDDDLYQLVVGDGSSKTIASGSLSVVGASHVIKAESNTAPLDTLTQIRDRNGTLGAGVLRKGQRLVLSLTSGETITVTHAAGTSYNDVFLNGSTSFVMTGKATLSLAWMGDGWHEIGRSAP